MEAKDKVQISTGAEYDGLFPRAAFKEITIKKNADVSNTVNFIPQVVRDTQWQTVKIAKILKGKTVYDTCKNVWHWVKKHIAYHKDEEGTEQVRSPARSWADRGIKYTNGHTGKGIDCDCYTTLISSILSNCGIEKIILRITKYDGKSYFQHIYPVVPTANGNIVMDCVVSQFNYEEPYTEKKDKEMDLNYLNGIEERGVTLLSDLQGTDELLGDDEMGDLGKGIFSKLKGLKIAKVFNLLNKLNPATMLLRSGMLICMKLNLFNVAKSLRWGYLTEEQAKKTGADMGRFAKYRKVVQQAEKIFYTAGGTPSNFKKAILRGFGNKNREVLAGLEGLNDDNFEEIDTTSIQTLLGIEIYNDELQGLAGADELGFPPAIAAATSAILALGKMVSSIGGMFPHKKNDDSGQVGEGHGTSPDAAIVQTASDTTNKNEGAKTETAPPPATNGFWAENKKWITPTAIGLGGITVAFLVYKAVNKPQTTSSPPANPVTPLVLSGYHKKKRAWGDKKTLASIELT